MQIRAREPNPESVWHGLWSRTAWPHHEHRVDRPRKEPQELILDHPIRVLSTDLDGARLDSSPWTEPALHLV